MKNRLKFPSIMVILLSSVIMSCGSNKSDLIGSWTLSHSEGFSKYGSEEDWEEWNKSYDANDAATPVVTFEENGNLFTMSVPHMETVSSSWEYHSKKLAISSVSTDKNLGEIDVQVYKVLKLTPTELIIENSDKDDDNEYYYMKCHLKKLQDD